MQVANSYIHIKYRRLYPSEFESLSESLLSIATELAQNVKRGRELDFTFEEGTLLQRIVLIGGLALGTLDVLSRYHDLRESIIDMVQDGETFGNSVIKEFHQLTNTTPSRDIYKRTSSRDMNRLQRIISSFDRVASSNIGPSELAQVRSQVIHDLAGLARGNPEDPEIAKIFRLLPKGQIPALPDSPTEAISMDETEFEPKGPPFAEPEVEPPPRRPRRRFHKRLALPKQRTRS